MFSHLYLETVHLQYNKYSQGGATRYAEYASAYPPMNFDVPSIPTIHVVGNYFMVDLKHIIHIGLICVFIVFFLFILGSY